MNNPLSRIKEKHIKAMNNICPAVFQTIIKEMKDTCREDQDAELCCMLILQVIANLTIDYFETFITLGHTELMQMYTSAISNKLQDILARGKDEE